MKTLSDLHAHIRSYCGNDTADQKAAAVARAAAQGITQLGALADWQFYRDVRSLTTVPSYATGTVGYDHPGGAPARLVTLAGGTFPTWAGSGSIEISGTVYDVASRVSGTALTLLSTSNPGADIAGGTGFNLYRAIYPLPAGTQSVDRMYVATDGNQRAIEARHPRDFLRDRSPSQTSGPPVYFGFLGEAAGGDVQVVVWPPSDRAYRLDYFAKRRPVVSKVQSVVAGLASATADSAAVTGYNTDFSDARHAGCVFRLSADNTPPTDEAGLNPWAVEALIDEVTSASALTLAQAATETLTKRAYEISGRIDIEDGPMWTLLLRLCERAVRAELRMAFVGDEPRSIQQALDAARQRDAARYSAPKVAGSRDGRYSRFVTSQTEDDT